MDFYSIIGGTDTLQKRGKYRLKDNKTRKDVHVPLPVDLYDNMKGQSKVLGQSLCYYIQNALECYCADIERLLREQGEGLGCTWDE